MIYDGTLALAPALGQYGPAAVLAIKAAYQADAVLINSVSLLAGALWITNDYLLGENKSILQIDNNGFTISASIGQDTIETLITNSVGFTLKNPNYATVLDGGVLAYDILRSPFWTKPIIQTFVNPAYSITVGSQIEASFILNSSGD